MGSMKRTVTLVDTANTTLGEADSIEAHSGEGQLHRAFSVYLFNPEKTSILLQQRSQVKMLFALLWANTCCSHPFAGESPEAAGKRRLQQELGITSTLTAGPSYVYRAEDPRGRGVEHEHVTTLLGVISESMPVHPDMQEVAAWKWVPIGTLLRDLGANPTEYAPWFHLGLPQVLLSPAFSSL